MPTSPRCPLLAGLAPLLLACHPAPSSKLDCTASLADIPMLVDVSWTAPEGTERSWVDFTTADGAEHHVVAEDPSGDIALLLLGAAPGEDVSWTGSSRDANGDVATCAGTITVGEPTSDLLDVGQVGHLYQVLRDAGRQAAGLLELLGESSLDGLALRQLSLVRVFLRRAAEQRSR